MKYERMERITPGSAPVQRLVTVWKNFTFSCCSNSMCSTKEDDDVAESKKKKMHESKLEVHFFSFTTLYYLVSSIEFSCQTYVCR